VRPRRAGRRAQDFEAGGLYGLEKLWAFHHYTGLPKHAGLDIEPQVPPPRRAAPPAWAPPRAPWPRRSSAAARARARRLPCCSRAGACFAVSRGVCVPSPESGACAMYFTQLSRTLALVVEASGTLASALPARAGVGAVRVRAGSAREGATAGDVSNHANSEAPASADANLLPRSVLRPGHALLCTARSPRGAGAEPGWDLPAHGPALQRTRRVGRQRVGVLRLRSSTSERQQAAPVGRRGRGVG
jgi:hypothetical protein